MYKKMNNKTGLYNDNYCSNCNITGHMYYNCKKPLLSNGIIAVKISENESNFLGENLSAKTPPYI